MNKSEIKQTENWACPRSSHCRNNFCKVEKQLKGMSVYVDMAGLQSYYDPRAALDSCHFNRLVC